MQSQYIPPALLVQAFHCPYCQVFAKQIWFRTIGTITSPHNLTPNLNANQTQISHCTHCLQYAVWQEETMIFPFSSIAPMPNSDMPEEIKQDFQEARAILNHSPRGAAALLRLAIQKLCIALGESGKDINQDIKSLVEKGLPKRVQQSLDIVRVVGNEAVHPGTMDLKDDITTANHLFALVNFIVEDMITRPKEVEAIYNSLPEGKLAGITARDKGAKAPLV